MKAGDPDKAWHPAQTGWYDFDDLKNAALLTDSASCQAQVVPHFPRSTNPFFDEDWYLNRYPPVRDAIRNGELASALDHFFEKGHRSLSPHWLFDPDYYRECYTKKHGQSLPPEAEDDPYDHYLRLGQFQGLTGHWLFEPETYTRMAPYGVLLLIEEHGPFSTLLMQLRAGDDPVASSAFDPAWYRTRYPDVAAGIDAGSWICALHHYLTNDTPLLFDPHPGFSDDAYLAWHFGLPEAVAQGQFRNGFEHFMRHGKREGRYFTSSELPPHTSATGVRRATPTRLPLRVSITGPVTFMPVRGDGVNAPDFCYGAMRPDGSPLPALPCVRPELLTAPETPDLMPGTYIYGGLLRDHYGHALIESLSRLWFIRNYPDVPVLWHLADESLQRGAWPEWLDQLWSLIGLHRHRHVFIAKPLTVEQVLLPDSGVVTSTSIHTEQIRALGLHETAAMPDGQRVWLSRRGLPDDKGRIEPEAEIEALLTARGWTVIRPETLPVARQADVFATASVISGCMGSAFHSVLLAARPTAKLVPVLRPWVSAEYFEAIAEARGVVQSYILPDLMPIDFSRHDWTVTSRDINGLVDMICAVADGDMPHRRIYKQKAAADRQ